MGKPRQRRYSKTYRAGENIRDGDLVYIAIDNKAYRSLSSNESIFKKTRSVHYWKEKELDDFRRQMVLCTPHDNDEMIVTRDETKVTCGRCNAILANRRKAKEKERLEALERERNPSVDP